MVRLKLQNLLNVQVSKQAWGYSKQTLGQDKQVPVQSKHQVAPVSTEVGSTALHRCWVSPAVWLLVSALFRLQSGSQGALGQPRVWLAAISWGAGVLRTPGQGRPNPRSGGAWVGPRGSWSSVPGTSRSALVVPCPANTTERRKRKYDVFKCHS